MRAKADTSNRRIYLPNTAKDQLFKPEQPEYVLPTNHVKASFLKVDFTAGETQSRLIEVGSRAEADYLRMAEHERDRQQKLLEFRQQTQDRAVEVRRQQVLEEKAKLEEVSYLIYQLIELGVGEEEETTYRQ